MNYHDEQRGNRTMTTIHLELEDELTDLLQQLKEPVENAVRELIVMELYRRGRISSGKAATLLGMPRTEFIRFASQLGIPYLDMTPAEWTDEFQKSLSL
jgi:predicted HTH domain antitoxin